MNKKAPLETLLKDYCNVNPDYKFEPLLKESKMKAKKTKIFTAACAACAALVLLGTVAFTKDFRNSQTSPVTEIENEAPAAVLESRDFFVRAYAEGEDKNAQELNASKKRINKDKPMISKTWYESDVKGLAANHIALEITGEDIENYSVKAKTGILYLNAFKNRTDFRITEKNVSPDASWFELSAVAKEVYDVPADPSVYNRGTFLFWTPSFDKIDDVTIDYDEKCALLQSAEDYNEYFGDTITISVNYKDGRTETAQIEITYDDDAYAYASISSVPEGLIMR